MTKNEVLELLWNEFESWMAGQTCGLKDNGEIDYYKCDVDAFMRKLRTGFDRQKSVGWD